MIFWLKGLCGVSSGVKIVVSMMMVRNSVFSIRL